MVLDETALSIQADILVDVTRCIVRFSAEDRANLEDALEDTHHDLLIELWTLRQEGRPAKVVQLEDGGTAFGGSGNKLGCLYLRKVTARECTAETSHCTSSQPQDSASCRMAVRDSPVVEQGTNTGSNLTLVQRNRWHLCHRGNNLNVQVM